MPLHVRVCVCVTCRRVHACMCFNARTNVHVSERMRLALQTCQGEREILGKSKSAPLKERRGERRSSTVHLRMKIS